jgi:hypothetical protein
MTHDDVRNGIPHGSGDGSGIIHPKLANHRDCVEEVFVDLCDICSWFDKQKQKVKWCRTTEGCDLVLCKPCFISIEEITLEGKDE